MQLAATTPAPTATAASRNQPPAEWASMPLGSFGYQTRLTRREPFETPDDPHHSWGRADRLLWTESGTSTMRTLGALGAQEGYATLTDATRALGELTQDDVDDMYLDSMLELRDSTELASATAAAVLEHAGRFYGYLVQRSHPATEAFEHEPQVEDNALYDGIEYTVHISRMPDLDPNVIALVDGYKGTWLLRD